jgi:hypothetical protein
MAEAVAAEPVLGFGREGAGVGSCVPACVRTYTAYIYV